MKADQILVFDVGGTTTRVGVFDFASDEIVRSARAPSASFLTHPGCTQTELLALFCETLETLAADVGMTRPTWVSLGFPGPINGDGVALRAPTLLGPDSTPAPVGRMLGELWPEAEIHVANDLTNAGYCYRRDPHDTFCVITVGSGIGHKVFVDGRPMLGRGGFGGEIGHVRVDASEDAPVCDCGGRGHLGALASGRATTYHAQTLARQDPDAFRVSAIGRSLQGDIGNFRNEIFVAAFAQQDAWATNIARRLARPLGQAIACMNAMIGLERFVIMGGMADALGDEFVTLLAEAAQASTWNIGQSWREMIELGWARDNVGLVGAAHLARQLVRQQSSSCQKASE